MCVCWSTFADHPPAARVRQRLAGLGTVRPVVPEIGIWSLAPRRPYRARALAGARVEVQSVEWSLARRDDDLPGPGETPVALAPPPAISDPFYAPDTQWSLFSGYWTPDLTGSGRRPRIAILDSGIDASHPEWSGPQSPLVDPYSSYQNVDSADDWGQTGHGTHVAGIAAAPANGVGIVGVAPAEQGVAEVIPVQIADRQGESTDETMMSGIRWAVTHGAKVINISAGGPGYSQAFQDTVDWAFARGAVIVASVGNDGETANDLEYPAAYQHVLGVAAQCDGQVDPPDCPQPFGVAAFSDHNGSVDLVAPGVNVLSSVPLRVHEREVAPGYALKSGTSMAAPFVAGTAALVFASHPGITPYQVIRQLENTATRPGGHGRDDRYGYGTVNPIAAVTEPAPPNSPGEPNDNVDQVAAARSLRPSTGPLLLRGYADGDKDPVDVYPVQLRRGDVLQGVLSHPAGLLSVSLWRPGTRTVNGGAAGARRDRVAQVSGLAPRPQTLVVRAVAGGRYYLVVRAERGVSAYTLRLLVR